MEMEERDVLMLRGNKKWLEIFASRPRNCNFFACNHYQGGDSFGFRVFHQRIGGKQKRNMQFHPQNEQIQNQYCCAA